MIIDLAPPDWLLLALLSVSLSVGGCTTVGPDYRPVDPGSPSTWEAPLPRGEQEAEIGRWWEQFDDPAVSRLVTLAEAGNPGLLKAWASIEKARAALASARASDRPSITASASASRERSLGVVQATRSGGLDASWEIDLFGKLRRTAEAAGARVEARTDDWHDTRISLAAEVADTYVQWRSCGLLVDAYERELQSNAQTDTATVASIRAGLTAPADGALARASLASARNSLIDQRAQCDALVKALVHLTGNDEHSLRTLMASGPGRVPKPEHLAVGKVPATVLRQRPDVASLERELAAATAEIGAAEASLYPSLSLSGSIGVSASTGVPQSFWSFGPSISLPIFDGGQRRATVSSAQADYLSAYASYQQGVRQAIKDVEEALVHLDAAANQMEQASVAEVQYRDYFRATERNWRAGNVSLLTLEEARRSALSAEIQRITLQRDHVRYWIALYKAVGGGWQPGQAVSTPARPSLLQ